MTHLANFCLFFKKICHQSRETSAPGDFFILSNFVKTYQSSKALASYLRAVQIFVRREIWQLFSFKNHDLKEKRFDFYAAINRWRWKILHDDQYSGYSEKNYHGVQFYVQAESPSLSSAQFLHRCGWHLLVNNFFSTFQSAHDWQILPRFLDVEQNKFCQCTRQTKSQTFMAYL